MYNTQHTTPTFRQLYHLYLRHHRPFNDPPSSFANLRIAFRWPSRDHLLDTLRLRAPWRNQHVLATWCACSENRMRGGRRLFGPSALISEERLNEERMYTMDLPV